MRSMNVAAVAALTAAICATSATAQAAMTLETFVTQANRIPINPLAAVRPDARRLVGVANRAFETVGAEITAAKTAGRQPAACPPEQIRLNPRQLLALLNGIPEARRARMTVADGFREWMASRYPCPPA